MSAEKSIEEVYEDRNLLAKALVAMAGQIYGADRVGRYTHDEWAVIYADLPSGQVSWHMRPEDVPKWLPVRDGTEVFDGHDREEKNIRLRQFCQRFWFDGDLHLPDGGAHD